MCQFQNNSVAFSAKQSRWDGTLPRTSYAVQVLTVGFNLRKDVARHVSTSPAGTTLFQSHKIIMP